MIPWTWTNIVLFTNLFVPELSHRNWRFNSSCLLSSLPPKGIIIALSHIGFYTKIGLLEVVCIVKILSHSAVQDKVYISAPLLLMAKIWRITGCTKTVPGSLNQMNEGEEDDEGAFQPLRWKYYNLLECYPLMSMFDLCRIYDFISCKDKERM